MRRAFAQQPIKGPSLPFGYLVPSPTTTLKPPTLRYGWRLGHDKLMDIAHKHFKEAVKYRFAPPTAGMGGDDDTDYDPEDYKEEQANIIETILSPDYIVAIQDLLGLPDWATDYIDIRRLYNSQCNAEWGLTVGSNYSPGVLKRPFIAKLEDILETDEPAMWYIDHCAWQWYRLPSLPKPKGKQPPILQQARVVLMLYCSEDQDECKVKRWVVLNIHVLAC